MIEEKAEHRLRVGSVVLRLQYALHAESIHFRFEHHAKLRVMDGDVRGRLRWKWGAAERAAVLEEGGWIVLGDVGDGAGIVDDLLHLRSVEVGDRLHVEEQGQGGMDQWR